MRKIAVITGSRADASPLSNVISLLGDSCIHIQTEGLFGHESAIRSKLEQTKPDMVLLLGDRYETLVAASVAALLAIPICHIHGGEETLGAVDNQFRHAITKLAYYHFTAHEDYAKRIIQMGEAPERVFVVGAPGLDQYTSPITQPMVENPFALVCLHPETLGNNAANLQQLSKELEDIKYLVSASNLDAGGDDIAEFWKERDVHPWTFNSEDWISLMRYADVLIGNSSSFILEGMTLGKKIIIIGDRQKGRYEEAQRHFAENKYAYGVPGEVSPKIVDLLLTLPIPEKPKKAFYEMR